MTKLHQLPEIYTLAVKRILLAWLQTFFAGRADFPFVIGDPMNTGIRIRDKHSFNLKTVSDIPAIALDRKPMRWVRSSIDQNLGDFRLRAAQAKMDLLTGQVIFHCLAKEGLVAEQVAHTVFFGLSAFDSEVRKMGLWDLRIVGIGEESILEVTAGHELVSVPVSITVYHQGKWVRRRVASKTADSVTAQVETC
jgi:hypothetical protein